MLKAHQELAGGTAVPWVCQPDSALSDLLFCFPTQQQEQHMLNSPLCSAEVLISQVLALLSPRIFTESIHLLVLIYYRNLAAVISKETLR